MLVGEERLNGLTHAILGAAIEVHRVVGPGVLEAVYCECLKIELAARGLRLAIERAIRLRDKDCPLQTRYRIDLIVEEQVVVEIKSVDALLPVHQAQVITYLKLTGCPGGLLINFNVPRLMDGVRRLFHPS